MPAFSTSMRSQVETWEAREEKVFWCVAREVDQVVRISSIVFPWRRDWLDGAVVVEAAAPDAGAVVDVAAGPEVVPAVALPAPKRPPACVMVAPALLEGGCDVAPLVAPKSEVPDAPVVAVAPGCEVPEDAAPPPRLGNRLDGAPDPPVWPLDWPAIWPVDPRLLNRVGA